MSPPTRVCAREVMVVVMVMVVGPCAIARKGWWWWWWRGWWWQLGLAGRRGPLAFERGRVVVVAGLGG